jgi:hypothetical protein
MRTEDQRAGRRRVLGLSRRLDIADLAAPHREHLAVDGVRQTLQRALDVLGGSFQRLRMLDVVRLAGDGDNVRSEPSRQVALVRCQRRQGPMMAAPGHCQHVPNGSDNEGRRHRYEANEQSDPEHSHRSILRSFGVCAAIRRKAKLCRGSIGTQIATHAQISSLGAGLHVP